MPNFNPPSLNWSWGDLHSKNADYALAHSTYGYVGNRLAKVGQWYDGSEYTIWRSAINFDTSSLGSAAVISQVNLIFNHTQYGDDSATDFDINIVKADWSGMGYSSQDCYDLILASDIDGLFFNTSGGFANNTAYPSANLSTTWVNKTGITYYGLISSRDQSSTPPTAKEHLEFQGSIVLSVTLGSTVRRMFPLLGVGK